MLTTLFAVCGVAILVAGLLCELVGSIMDEIRRGKGTGR